MESTETPDVPVIQYTAEELAVQKELLENGIARGMEWFEEAKDGDVFAGMSRKEQAFSRLLDPMVWLMREALVTFEHDDCEECKVRRETGGNGLGLAIAEMLLQDDSADVVDLVEEDSMPGAEEDG